MGELLRAVGVYIANSAGIPKVCAELTLIKDPLANDPSSSAGSRRGTPSLPS